MNITVFGASGKVGQLVVRQLLTAGHDVSAFVHKTAPFADHDRLRKIHGDIYNQADIENALQNSQAVISCLGSWGTPDKNILTTAMKNIIPVMEKHAVTRIVSLTGSAAALPDENLGLIDKLNRSGLNLLAHKILYDGEEHMRLLHESQLDWTVIRSPVMTNGSKNDYKLSLKTPSPFSTISRNAVARAMVEQLSVQNFLNASPHINRR